MSATVHREAGTAQRATPADQPSPQNGDVVVTRHAESRVHYTIRQLPGIVQFSAGVCDHAVRLARGFAQQYSVDVWYCDAGAYRLLEAYRPRTPAPDRSVRGTGTGGHIGVRR